MKTVILSVAKDLLFTAHVRENGQGRSFAALRMTKLRSELPVPDLPLDRHGNISTRLQY